MRSFLIEPRYRSIRLVEYSGNWRDIAPMLGCTLFDAVQFDDQTGDSVYVDDEGRMVENPSFFMIFSYPLPLAGNGLVLGLDRATGETVEPKISLEQLAQRVRFL